jgi:hypothetical protein
LPAEVPDHVRRFIEDHVDSVELIEVLLLLKREHGRDWTAEEVAARLYTSVRFAAHRLDALRASSLASMSEREGTPAYRFAPQTADLDRVVRDLEAHYAERRTSIVALIFSRSTDKLKTFADAFRIREDE